MRQIFLILTLSILYSSAVGQKADFESGYYISSSGERVEGLILNEKWTNSPDQISFKQNALSSLVVLEANEFQEFGVADLKYERHDVLAALNVTDSDKELGEDRNAEQEKQTLLLKVIIEGPVSFYSYVQGNIIKYFYSTPSTGIEQLIYNRYYKRPDEIAENNYYQQQLFLNVNCDKPQSYFSRLRYSKSSLEKYFIKHYECTGESFIHFEGEESSSGFHLTPKLGINYSKFDFNHPVYTNEYESQMNLTYGIEGEYIFPFQKKSWSALLGVTFQKYEPDSNIRLVYKSFEISPGVRRYFHLKDETSIHLSATYTIDIPTWSIFGQRKISSGENLNLGAGVIFSNRYFLQFEYGMERKIYIDSVDEYSNYSTMVLHLGYRVF